MVKMSNKSLQIKVCGMRDPHNLEQVCALAPEFVGFIFYPGSKRFVGTTPDPALFDIPGTGIKKVGVFVNEELSKVRRAIDLYSLDMVQLHGGESAEYCASLSGGTLVIKVMVPYADQSEIEKYRGVVDFFLFDSPGEGFGGTGQKFDWNLLEHLTMTTPFLLSGGIGPEDITALRSIDLQGLMGIDINSRFEISPGQKDTVRLNHFFNKIRKIEPYGL
jgi:phosphoribosylanthranilate isomerase